LQAKLGIVVANCTPDVRSWAHARVVAQQQQKEKDSERAEVLFMSERPRAAGIMEGLVGLGFLAHP
jgi:hypothetical protein